MEGLVTGTSFAAKRKMRAAKSHDGAEHQSDEAGEQAGYRRDGAGRGSGLAGGREQQHADRDQEMPHSSRNLAGYRTVHQ